MLRYFYRWLYHYRVRREAKNRLNHKGRPAQRFWRFGYHVLHRAQFDKYDKLRTRVRVVLGVGLALLGLASLWFVWESLKAWSIFQG